jgi:hypothetical protein
LNLFVICNLGFNISILFSTSYLGFGFFRSTYK